MRILVVVLSCNKNKNLWKNLLKDKDVIIFTGGSDRDYLENNILYLNCNDFYEGLPEKVILMIEQVLKLDTFKDVTHILKIDDHDTFFTPENINNLYTFPQLQNSDFIGQKLNYDVSERGVSRRHHFKKVTPNSYWDNKVYEGNYVPWLDGGMIYILSRKAMININNVYNSSNIELLRKTEIYEDVMIAKVLLLSHISPIQVNLGIKGDKNMHPFFNKK